MEEMHVDKIMKPGLGHNWVQCKINVVNKGREEEGPWKPGWPTGSSFVWYAVKNKAFGDSLLFKV